ncbi:outer membrane protein assembly factor BamB family protein [Planctomicrobium sp. SH527]|uniref:outer membrane protein assembly factor BamB family protein n=1 Tax=Planctomicrobium sp. SH527 TaxID=3448123 RepID=UPI003F5C82A6
MSSIKNKTLTSPPGRLNCSCHRPLGFLLGVALAVFGLLQPEIVCADDEPSNPLESLFKNLDRGIRDVGDELSRQKSGRDPLDLRLIQRPEQARQLKTVKELIEEGRWHDVTDQFQFLLSQPADAFEIGPNRVYRSLLKEVDQLVTSLPEEGRRNYLSKFSAVADRQLQQAMTNLDQDELQEVAMRYGHTPAGRTALRTLAQLWRDQGMYGQAASAWERLIALAPAEVTPELETQYALALARCGRTGTALQVAEKLQNKELLDQIARLGATGNIPAGTSSLNAGAFFSIADPQVSAAAPNPVFARVWSQPLIERYNVKACIEELAEDMRAQGRALLPTIQPLTVNGIVVYRTLRSLQARDSKTGHLLWEHRTPDSPEVMLTRREASDEDIDLDDPQHVLNLGFADGFAYREALFENHPIASLIYRDEVYGGLTSDGMRVFSVESTGEALMTAPVYAWDESQSGETPENIWSTNELAAYDLQTGQTLWRIGGTRIEEPFSRPLSGTFFFGPPTPSGGMLYSIGEQNGEVQLFCLNARTGEVEWSQPLANPGRQIGVDAVRRHWPCRPVIAEGLILCPTNCGWFLAVDQATRRLRWAARYSPRIDQRRGYRGNSPAQSVQQINRRWQNAIPVVTSGHVLFTPPEFPDEFGITHPMIYCLDLQTGKTLWSHSKQERPSGTTLYLAGVWNDFAILVGTEAVSALKVSGGGKVAWTLPLLHAPTGRGLIVNQKLFLPVETRNLLQIDLETASIEMTTTLVDSKSALGNLTLDHDVLLCLSYDEIAAFPANAPQGTPDSGPLALVQQAILSARQQLSAGNWETALNMLEATSQSPMPLPEEFSNEIEELQFQGLSAKLKSEGDHHDATLLQLHKVATSLNQIPRYQRLLADHLAANGDLEHSLKILLDVLEQAGPSDVIREETRTVRIDGWVGPRFQNLYQQLSDAASKEAFDAEVAARIARLPVDRELVLDRWARAFMFHPLGLQLELNIAQADHLANRPSSVLIRSQRVIDSGHADFLPQALRLQATQLVDLGWYQDALAVWERLEKLPDAVLPDRQSSLALATAGVAQAQEHLKSKSVASFWKGAWRIEREGLAGDESSLISIKELGKGQTQLQSLRFLADQKHDRFRIENRITGEFLGSYPFRGDSELNHQSGAVVRLQGASALMVHQGVIQSLDWTTQRIAWSWSPELRPSVMARLAVIPSQHSDAMLPATQFLATRQYYANRDQAGFLVTGTQRTLLLLCRDWVALDPLTGEELWRDTNAPERAFAHAFGAGEFLVSGTERRELRREVDGAILPSKELTPLLSRTISILDGDLIVIQRPVPGGSTATLQRVSKSGGEVWSRELTVRSWISSPSAELLLWRSEDDDLMMIDLRDGSERLLANLKDYRNGSQSPVHVISERDRFYIVIENRESSAGYLGIQGVPATGAVLCFDRAGELKWTLNPQTQVQPLTSLSNKNRPPRSWPLKLLTQDFSDSPVVLLVADVSEHSGEHYFHRLKVVAVDKATGKIVIDQGIPSESGGFSYVYVNLEHQRIELRTYNEQLRLIPDADVVGAAPAAD